MENPGHQTAGTEIPQQVARCLLRLDNGDVLMIRHRANQEQSVPPEFDLPGTDLRQFGELTESPTIAVTRGVYEQTKINVVHVAALGKFASGNGAQIIHAYQGYVASFANPKQGEDIYDLAWFSTETLRVMDKMGRLSCRWLIPLIDWVDNPPIVVAPKKKAA